MRKDSFIFKVLLFLVLMVSFCASVNAQVYWKYIKSPKYKVELLSEYNKIPQKARDIYDDVNLRITIYGYNYYKNYAGLYNGDVFVESFKLSWLGSFYKRRGVKTNLSKKELSINYAKCTLIHELGHAFDYNSGGYSFTSEFKKIYKAEKTKFTNTKYYKYPMGKIKENISNPQEYFASTFTVYVRSPKDLKKHCPKTYNYFKKLFG